MIVPGCGEEIIPFRWPLGVTREEYRVTPMAVDGRRRNLGLLPFRSQCALQTHRVVPGALRRWVSSGGGKACLDSHRELRTG